MVIEIAVAVELLQCGWSPDEAAALVKVHRNDIILAGISSLAHEQRGLAAPVMLIYPSALKQLSWRPAEDGLHNSAVYFVTRRRLAQIFGQPTKIDPERWRLWRAAVIDIPTLMRSLITSIHLGGQSVSEIAAAFQEQIPLRLSDLKKFCAERVDELPDAIVPQEADDGGS